MNLNDQFHFYFNLDLTPIPLKPRKRKLPARKGNERNPDVDEHQRHLANTPANITVRCGENLAVIDSAPVLTAPSAFSANSRSPPLSNRLLFPA